MTLLPAVAAARGVTPSEFAPRALWRDGRPFSFHGRPHLPAIYDDPFDVLMKCSRQTEKSTTLANLIGAFLFGGRVVEDDGLSRAIRLLYFTASMVQAHDFSKDRLARVLESPCFTESAAGGTPLWPRSRDARSRTFTDQVAEKRLRSGASIKIRACHDDADRVRGLSSDVIFGDELQDVLSDLMPVIEESAARSPLRKRVYAGTPKTYENNIETRWQESTRNEWMVICTSCHRTQMLTEKNLGRTWMREIQSGCVCAHCGRPLDPKRGRWVSHGNADAPIHGYRICHIMLPQSEDAWTAILHKRETYTEQAFQNEVLGFSHEHANAVLTEAELLACCTEERRNGSYPGYYLTGLSAGVDWGGPGNSATVLTIGAFHDDVFRVLYMQNFKQSRLSTDDVIGVIARICAKWSVRVIGTDFGSGVKENLDLRRVCSGSARVLPFQYVGNAHKTIRWDAKTGVFVTNRTKTMATLFQAIRLRHVEFFRRAEFEPFKPGFLSCFQEWNERTGDLRYDHPDNRPDDELHSLNYAYLAASGQTGRYGAVAKAEREETT